MKRLHLALVLLSFGAGAADAFAFLALNGTFTANMTGNLILVALFTRPGFPVTLLCALVAIIVFAVVLYLAFRATMQTPTTQDVHRSLIRRLLFPSIFLQLVVVVAWTTSAHVGSPSLLLQCSVIAFSAAALALQTVAAKKLSDIGGVTTTYVTGTLTTTMQALAERDDRGQALRVLSILALPCGALASTAAYHAAEWTGPIIAFAVTTAATATALGARPRPDHS
jgi:uncharacterized membrane protein YoaK (UPF0700 family)